MLAKPAWNCAWRPQETVLGAGGGSSPLAVFPGYKSFYGAGRSPTQQERALSDGLVSAPVIWLAPFQTEAGEILPAFDFRQGLALVGRGYSASHRKHLVAAVAVVA